MAVGPQALRDDDLHLALYLCYELFYGELPGVDREHEWDPGLLELRSRLEGAFLAGLHEAVPLRSVPPGEVGDLLFEIAADDRGPSLSQFLQRRADREQFREFAIHRSAYQLKEADPHSWAIPRLRGGPKSALIEIQSDEYGGGRPERMHSALFAKTMLALGLDARPGAYLDRLPGVTLATVNLMSLLGLHGRWRGAIVGHLAMFEMTSSIPNRRYGDGLRRLGFDGPATDFFDEHVEADAVHENIAAYDLAQGLAMQQPELAGQIVFGAEALLELEARFSTALL
ncbi:MAG: iron-containing redox enzyme family protein, partial [Solirubrobacterales bacterium]